MSHPPVRSEVVDVSLLIAIHRYSSLPIALEMLPPIPENPGPALTHSAQDAQNTHGAQL